MSSSSLSHAGASAGDEQAASDSNHSPTMMMSQPPNHSGPIQVQHDPDVNGGPYVPVHRGHPYGVPEGYPHHVMPYVQGPAPGQSGHPSELMYSVDPSQQTETQEEDETPPPPSFHGNGSGKSGSSASLNGKRKHPDSTNTDASGKKRRQRAAGGEDGEEIPEADVGPNGGAKHWTEEEKTRFFNWMLTNDEHWDAFRTRMNTVFRECSSELFPGRKSYTALKSCYHRNLELFKQVHAFQMFSANRYRQLQAENPNTEQPSVEIMLEAARNAGLNVGNLNVKVIDRWYETGWFELFKRRYREDPKTGLPVPYFGPVDQLPEGPPAPITHSMMGLHAAIDPQLMTHQAAQSGPEVPYVSDGSQQTFVVSSPPPQQPDYRQSGPSSAPLLPQQPLPYLRSSSSISSARVPPTVPATPSVPRTPRVLTANGSTRRLSPDCDGSPDDSFPNGTGGQFTHALSQLTTVTESLLGVCSSLKELLRQQMEESKTRTELMQQQIGRDGDGTSRDRDREISIEKVQFATEILKNGPQNDDIKKAAIECLTKYFMRDL